MKRTWPHVAILSFLLTLILPSVAFAHVTVSPEEVQPGTTQTFTVVAPTEKDVPTTGISLRIPEGFEVTSVQSPPGGWRGGAEDGSVSWSGGEIGAGGIEITSPEGEVIPMGESQEFTFEASTPEAPDAYAWPVSQTYKDGSVVEWAGPNDSEKPAPVVQVAAGGPESTAPKSAGHHDNDEGAGSHGHAGGGGENAATRNAGDQGPPYALVGTGVLVACAATLGLVALRGRGGSSGNAGRRQGP